MCVYRLPCWLRGKESAGSAGDTGEAGSGRSLEEGMATHASIPAWNIPWTEEPGGPRSIASQSQTWVRRHIHACVFIRVYAKCKCYSFSCLQRFATTWTVPSRAPLSIGFSRQEYWSGLPCSPPGNLPNPGIKPRSPAFQVNSLLLRHRGKNSCVIDYM